MVAVSYNEPSIGITVSLLRYSSSSWFDDVEVDVENVRLMCDTDSQVRVVFPWWCVEFIGITMCSECVTESSALSNQFLNYISSEAYLEITTEPNFWLQMQFSKQNFCVFEDKNTILQKENQM